MRLVDLVVWETSIQFGVVESGDKEMTANIVESGKHMIK